jgi:retinol dehydrogenase-12
MGHALLMKLLTPILLETASTGADVRTISLSSAGHRFGKKELVFDSMKGAAANLSPTDKYCHSKLGEILFSRIVVFVVC